MKKENGKISISIILLIIAIVIICVMAYFLYKAYNNDNEITNVTSKENSSQNVENTINEEKNVENTEEKDTEVNDTIIDNNETKESENNNAVLEVNESELKETLQKYFRINSFMSCSSGYTLEELGLIEKSESLYLNNKYETWDDDRTSKSYWITDISFNEFIHKFRDLGCSNFESVRRTRQMVQSQYPELGCSPKARRARSRGQKAYEKYAKEAAENGKG